MRCISFPTRQLKITRSVNFRWSNRNEGELYITLKDRSTVIGTKPEDSPQAACCIAAIVHTLSDNLYASSCVFPRVIDCVLFQNAEDGSMSIMHRERTGMAVIQILNYKSSKVSGKILTCALILEAPLRFSAAEMEGTKDVAATVNFDDVSLRKMSIEAFKHHQDALLATPTVAYQ